LAAVDFARRVMSGHMDDAIEAVRHRAGPGDRDRPDARSEMLRLVACSVIGIKLVQRFLDDLPQTKLDLLLRQGNALNVALNKVPITVRELLARAAGAEMIAQCGQHQRLKLSRGNTAERCGRPRFL